MLHGPAVELDKDNAISRKTRLGAILFCVYLLIYTGFVIIGTLFPRIMGKVVGGIANIAIVYGMGLIVLAVIMGYIYNYFCTKFEEEMNVEAKQ